MFSFSSPKYRFSFRKCKGILSLVLSNTHSVLTATIGFFKVSFISGTKARDLKLSNKVFMSLIWFLLQFILCPEVPSLKESDYLFYGFHNLTFIYIWPIFSIFLDFCSFCELVVISRELVILMHVFLFWVQSYLFDSTVHFLWEMS